MATLKGRTTTGANINLRSMMSNMSKMSLTSEMSPKAAFNEIAVIPHPERIHYLAAGNRKSVKNLKFHSSKSSGNRNHCPPGGGHSSLTAALRLL